MIEKHSEVTMVITHISSRLRYYLKFFLEVATEVMNYS